MFEAHPEIFHAIKKIHRFNAYQCAVFNEDQEMTFNIIPINSSNSGISSVFKLNGDFGATAVTVNAIRMDNFMQAHKIERIDFLKLDVEEATYEVLEGFGGRLKDVQAMHIEAEHGKWIFSHIKNFDDIQQLLAGSGLEMVYFQKNGVQSDSFWVRREILK